MGWMQEAPVLLCMLWAGGHGRSEGLLWPKAPYPWDPYQLGSAQLCSLPGWGLCQVPLLGAPSLVSLAREDVGLCSMRGERGNKSFQKVQMPGSRAATSLCSFHPGFPFLCVMLIFLASWTNYGPFSVAIYESIDGRSTNATM